MRYRAYKSSLALITQDGTVKYQFKNYLLDTGANPIDPDLAGTDPKSVMQDIYSSGTDLEKVGQGIVSGDYRLFIEAPLIIEAGTLDNGSNGPYYEIVVGPVDLTAAAYLGKYALIYPLNAFDPTNAGPGTVIRVVTDITVPAGNDVWARTFPPGLKLDEPDHDMRGEHFVINNLSSHKDESAWDPQTFGAKTKAVGYTRE